MLLSAAIMMSVAFRRWRTVLPGLGLCAYLACVPVSVVDLGAPYPAPHNRPGTEGLWVTELPPGEVWTYRFPLRDLRESGEGAAPAGFLYIDGRDLSGLVVEVQGNARTASERIGTKNGFDHLSIPLGDERAAVLTVALHGAGRNTPRIYHGPEVHGFSVYGDAVWLEFTGSRNRIIYHAMRGVAKTGAH
jgi:hypothetical protein